MPIYQNVAELIGRTPVVRLGKLAPPGVNLYAKLESMNPGGSVKDRLALGVIEAAERSGELRPGQTIVEATSGNTGIGLAMVCAQRGYPLVIVMSEAFSVERRKLMRFYGAKVVLTPAVETGVGMLGKARELADAHGWFMTRQFENEANADVHSRTTAIEIVEDFAELGLDYWVTGFGTGGTLKGVARVLKERSPRTRIVAVEADNSPVFASGIKQPWPADGLPTRSHPMARPHPIQGIGPDFIPKLVEDARRHVDRIVSINAGQALRCAHELAEKEGLLTGVSSGAALAAALKVAESAAPGANILAMLPDTGERYLSTPLYQDVAVDMTAEELEISRSTPRYRFDVPASVREPEPETAAVSDAARAFVAEAIDSRERPVVLFALEWCEFCWAVRRLFERCKIAYRSVDIDSAALQADNWGGQIRAALTERTSMRSIPQAFVGGELVGGATEVFAAFADGRLQALLARHEVSFEDTVGDALYSLMPGWSRRGTRQ
ncbi:MAG TPA: cysteine synthase A [Kofleriaceae bacterium]|nr:cysteine synthase A [Kofleriaceae bacterium]